MFTNVRFPAMLVGLTMIVAVPAAAQDSVKVTSARVYEGQFRPIQQASGGVGMRGSQRVFGQVKIATRESSERVKVTLMINTSLNQTEILNWSVNPGRCGSGSVPLMPIAQFQGIEMSTNGRGELDIPEMQMAIPANSGALHVNVFRGGTGLDNVIACSNLKLNDK
ncbi:hypothetical protein [Gemmatimonas sp.]|jgi:hypothetical protein|uniref:hypothetical protein n=1 Tax=Gemmatimonas sp. TaxID=1962908 RepID=UPI0037BECCEA